MPPPEDAQPTPPSQLPPAPPPKPNYKILSILLKAVIMVSITSVFFLLVGLASLFLLPVLLSSLHRHRRHRVSSNGFSTKRLKKLPQFKFLKKTETFSGNQCVVCLDGFKQGQWCRRLVGCGHVFHRKCVDTWLVRVSACPICRTAVRLEDDKEEFWASFGRRRTSPGFST